MGTHKNLQSWILKETIEVCQRVSETCGLINSWKILSSSKWKNKADFESLSSQQLKCEWKSLNEMLHHCRSERTKPTFRVLVFHQSTYNVEKIKGLYREMLFMQIEINRAGKRLTRIFINTVRIWSSKLKTKIHFWSFLWRILLLQLYFECPG